MGLVELSERLIEGDLDAEVWEILHRGFTALLSSESL